MLTPSKIVGTSGIAAITGALAYFFSLLTNPDYLSALLVEIQTHQDVEGAGTKLLAATFGIIGSVTVTCVGFWLAHSPLATFTVTETHTVETKGTQPQTTPEEKGPP